MAGSRSSVSVSDDVSRGGPAFTRRPSVLVVTGAYYPEISGGGLQARELIRTLNDRVDFTVLTTSAVKSETAPVDGVRVHRVAIDVRRVGSRVAGAIRLTWHLLRLGRRAQVVHVQGFSRKNVLVTAIAKLFGKRVVLTLQTALHDDPDVVEVRSRLGLWSIREADTIVAVSEALRAAAVRASVTTDRLRGVPNGVDTTRFRPAAATERQALRRRLSLPPDKAIVLFVGFFSRDKGPHRLFEAFRALAAPLRERTTVLFIGQTGLPHPEVDPTLAEEIRRDGSGTLFVEHTLEIEAYYRAADIFVLPSSREGCSNALLEAMATGLPVISTRLPGSTDSMITDGTDGRFAPPDDVAGLCAVLGELLSDPAAAARYGIAARETACRRFSLGQVSAAYLDIYRTLSAS